MIYNLSRIKKKKLSTWTVEAISGASYGFELNSNNYYESKNKGVDNSYAICRVKLNLSTKARVIFNCINYAESNYDYGLLGNVDTALTLNASADSNVAKSFKGSSQSGVQTFIYTIEEGEHFIDVKYRKDGSVNNNNDTLQFTVEIQEIGKESTYTVEAVYGASYGFSLNSNGYYESTNKGVDNSASVCRVRLNLVSNSNIIFTCINYAESNFDFGILGKVNNGLLADNIVDTTYEKSFKGLSQSSPQTYTYTSVAKGERFIDVKYVKDSSQSSGNDSFQFKIEIQEVV